jgi:hypothetical protein
MGVSPDKPRSSGPPLLGAAVLSDSHRRAEPFVTTVLFPSGVRSNREKYECEKIVWIKSSRKLKDIATFAVTRSHLRTEAGLTNQAGTGRSIMSSSGTKAVRRKWTTVFLPVRAAIGYVGTALVKLRASDSC